LNLFGLAESEIGVTLSMSGSRVKEKMLSLSNLAVNRVMTFALSSNSGSFFESVNFANFSRSDRTSERFDLERPELSRPFFVDESQLNTRHMIRHCILAHSPPQIT